MRYNIMHLNIVLVVDLSIQYPFRSLTYSRHVLVLYIYED